MCTRVDEIGAFQSGVQLNIQGTAIRVKQRTVQVTFQSAHFSADGGLELLPRMSSSMPVWAEEAQRVTMALLRPTQSTFESACHSSCPLWQPARRRSCSYDPELLSNEDGVFDLCHDVRPSVLDSSGLGSIRLIRPRFT